MQIYALLSKLLATIPGYHSTRQITPSEQKHADYQAETRSLILSFLRRCHLHYPSVTYDHEFEEFCCDEARSRGYVMEGPHSLRPFMPAGVSMATTAYAHLPNKSTKLFIALYTAFLVYLDDIFEHDVRSVTEFNERFITHLPQMDPVLNNFASLLFEIPIHFSRIQANLIVASTLNLVTALSVEHDTNGMSISYSAHRYPTWSRVLSGASEAYTLFMFPSSQPLRGYIQALPETMVYINNVNDILSFYKEESSGDTLNRPSLLAKSQQISKHDALIQLADGAVEAHARTLAILSPSPESLDCFQRFCFGYIGFHAVLSRYRLDELNLS